MEIAGPMAIASVRRKGSRPPSGVRRIVCSVGGGAGRLDGVGEVDADLEDLWFGVESRG